MKVKNVIKGLRQKWNLQEINIISPTRVIYSGTVECWDATDKDVYMILHKKKVENLEVTDRMMFNGRKAFLFVPEIGDYYPEKDV